MPNRTISEVIRNQQMLSTDSSVSVRDAACRMAQENVGALLIIGDGRLQGIFTERDLLIRVVAAGRNIDTTRLDEVMTRNPQTIDTQRPFGHALHLMYDGGFRHLPVVENGRPVGVISIRDALGPEITAFENELERRDTLMEIMV